MQTEVIGGGHCIWRHAAHLLSRQHLLSVLQAARLALLQQPSPSNFKASNHDPGVIVKAAATGISSADVQPATTKPSVRNDQP